MKIKKILAVTAATAILASVLTGCGTTKKEPTVILIGASPAPHTEILKHIEPQLKAKGYTLKIITYQDYVQPNVALSDGTLDANYFQHQPYLDNFNKENKATLVSAGSIHYEPLGIYPGKTKSLADLKSGATIAIPNDTTNEARALLLLEANNLIKLDASKGLNATVSDITTNTKNLKITTLDAAQIPRSLQDVDLGVINGNYALGAGLSITKDALAQEDAKSLAAKTYANIVAVRKGDENKASIKALVEVLKSADTQKWITDNYKGAVVPYK